MITKNKLTLNNMAYTPIPTESRKKINKAGKLLTKQIDMDNIDEYFDEYFDAVDLVNRWRSCHAYPINTFQATLRTNLKSYKGSPIVAQRLKRMPTVLGKLKRHANMQLSTMQDIGGVRGIVDDMSDLYKIVDKYVNNSKFPHELVERYDYVESPRDEDGYRSIHLVYKYNNKVRTDFNGLRVEIQLRTKIQHVWATAVETVGVFLKQSLKTRQGDEGWLNFFAIMSSAFAYIENTPPINRFSHLSLIETCIEIAKQEKKLRILDQIKDFSYVVDTIGDTKGHSYHLIINNNTDKTITIHSYNRISQQKALKDFDAYEQKQEQNTDVTLVSAGRIETLRKAYPNLFLDLSEFVELLKEIITVGSKGIEVFRKE